MLLLRTFTSFLTLLGTALCVWKVGQTWEKEDKALRDRVKVLEERTGREEKPFLVVVDAGHGGIDGGTKGHELLEKDVALDIARRVAACLRQLGCRVEMTRSDDTFVVLEERSAMANRTGADVFVSIHLNADGNSGITAGVETYFSSRKRIGNTSRLRSRLGLRHDVPVQDERSALLARLVQRRLCTALRAPDRGARDSNYVVAMLTECPAILIECGYLTNESDSDRFREVAYRDTLSWAAAGAVMDFLRSTQANPVWGFKFEPPPAAPELPLAGASRPVELDSAVPLPQDPHPPVPEVPTALAPARTALEAP